MKCLMADTKITILLVILIVCSILLALLGALGPPLAVIMAIGSLSVLVSLGWQGRQIKLDLRRRGAMLQADGALQVRHLGGLPIPLHTVGSLFLLPAALRIETDQASWELPLTQISQMMPLSGEQLKRLTDQQLQSLLGAGSSRLLSTVRDHIRRNVSTIRQSELLLITYQAAAPAIFFRQSVVPAGWVGTTGAAGAAGWIEPATTALPAVPADPTDIFLLILSVVRQHRSLLELLSLRQVQSLLMFSMVPDRTIQQTGE